MPTSMLTKMASEHGVDVSKAEKYWSKAKKIAREAITGGQVEFKVGSDQYWSYVVGIVKKMMGDKAYLQAASIEETAMNRKKWNTLPHTTQKHYLKLHPRSQAKRWKMKDPIKREAKPEPQAEVPVEQPLEVKIAAYVDKAKPSITRKLKDYVKKAAK